MYRVLFAPGSKNNLQQYFNYVRKYFDALYFDTGLIDLATIKDNYNSSIKRNNNAIEDKIMDLATNGLLGYKPNGFFDNYELCENSFQLKSYRVTFESRIYKKDKVITIETIKISKGR